jgi:hypothetical protein
MRLLVADNALAAYPDHNKQLGACIIQERRPVAYFLRKLTKSQQNHTTMEKEMLSIIATLEKI